MLMRWKVAAGAVAAFGAVAVHDLVQRRHAILRNFPVIGHGRYAIERIGPELRQYVVASNDEERPFSRDQRSWIYASSKLEDNHAAFGTDNDVENDVGYPIFKHRTFVDAHEPIRIGSGSLELPAAKVMGAARGRPGAFRPRSVINVSGMSFGALSGGAVAAMNRGVALAGALQNTGEGGLSEHHRHGGELIFQIGTAYFGVRDEAGDFDLAKLVNLVRSAPVRAIEIKLSQGAKPGLGGLLPGVKVSAEIARVRGIPEGEDCSSPGRHTAFHDVDSLLDFVETIAEATGLPVGIKSAVGHLEFFDELADSMAADPSRGIDFLTIDGGEGGTGAAPRVFSDAVAYPFRIGFAEVYRRFAERGLADDVVFIGSGKLGVPENALVAFALGADMLHVAREAMMAVGCIQAQKCHTDRCPVGVATQNPRYTRGLDVPLKADRLANYVSSLRRDLLSLSEAIGVSHPGLVTVDDVDLVDQARRHTSLREIFGYPDSVGSLGPELAEQASRLARVAGAHEGH